MQALPGQKEGGERERDKRVKSPQCTARGPCPAGRLALVGWPMNFFGPVSPQNDVVLGTDFVFFFLRLKKKKIFFLDRWAAISLPNG